MVSACFSSHGGIQQSWSRRALMKRGRSTNETSSLYSQEVPLHSRRSRYIVLLKNSWKRSTFRLCTCFCIWYVDNKYGTKGRIWTKRQLCSNLDRGGSPVGPKKLIYVCFLMEIIKWYKSTFVLILFFISPDSSLDQYIPGQFSWQKSILMTLWLGFVSE